MSAVDNALKDYVVQTRNGPKVVLNVEEKRITADLRDPLQFEDKIIKELTASNQRGDTTGGAVPVKGRWIHDWLSHHGEDYINSIYKNYVFFTVYLRGKTSLIKNVGTYKRYPGTYDSTYRYILLLEELGLVERYRNVDVPADEYDFPVPDEFRNRTFVRVTAPYEGNQNKWDNPYEALYPEGEKSEEEPEEPEGAVPEPEEEEGFQIDVQPAEDLGEEETESEGEGSESGSESTGGTSPATIDIEPGEVERATEPEEEETGPKGLDEMTGGGGSGGKSRETGAKGLDEMTSGGGSGEAPHTSGGEIDIDIEEPSEIERDITIDEFPYLDELEAFIENNYPDAIYDVFDNAPLPTPDLDPEDFELSRIAIFGDWADEGAEPGEDTLSVAVGIYPDDAPRKPGFVTAGTQSSLEEELNENNELDDWFPEYFVRAVWSSQFKQGLREMVKQEQEVERFYDLGRREWIEV